MKKSDTVFETDIHELFHMTQRNVHNRSEYEHTAFNRTSASWAWTLPTTTSSRSIVIRVSGTCTHTGAVTVLFIYNNRGLYPTGVQQSVVRL